MPNSLNFGRVIEVLVNSRSFILDDYKIEFDAAFDSDPEPNTGSIKIYNLSDTTINEIKKDQKIILNAGYKNDVGTIFAGSVIKKSQEPGIDKILTLNIGDSVSEWTNSRVNKTYRPGITAKQVIDDIVKGFGLEIGIVELSVNPTYSKGRVISGSLQSVLKEIVVNDCKTKFHISNGIIIIRPTKAGKQTGFLLNSDTGLLQTPTPIEDEASKSDYSVKCLLNHRLTTDSLIKIESKTANGDFIVIKGSHKGSDSGDFVTEMEVAAI